MAALRIIIVVSLSILGGFLIGVQVASSPTDASGTPDSSAGIESPADLGGRIHELNSELKLSRLEEARLRSELSRAQRQTPAADGEQDSESTDTPTQRFSPASGPGRVITKLEEAEAAYERAIAAGDLEALWLLGADLLAFGEAGYPLFETLLEDFIRTAKSGANDLIGAAFKQEELWMGRFFRTLAEEHESFLAYGLHLSGRDAEELSPALTEFRHELFDDALLPMLLAFHGGENPDLTAGWLDQLEMRLATPDLDGADEETVLFALAHIPGDRAADLLVHWIETQESHRDDALSALLLQGSARALAALRQLLPSIENEELRAAIENRLGQ